MPFLSARTRQSLFNFYIKYIILLSFEVVPIVSPCSDNNSTNNNSSRSIAWEQQTHFRSSLLSLGGRKATNGKRRSLHLQELHLIKLVLDHSKSLLTSSAAGSLLNTRTTIVQSSAHLRQLNKVLAVCDYMSFAKSWRERGFGSQAETWQVKNVLAKDFD